LAGENAMNTMKLNSLFRTMVRGSLVCSALILVGLPATAQAAATPVESSVLDKQPDVIYVPTPQSAVDRMLEMAKIQKGDLLYDLGCGDGRIMVTAAKRYGIKAVGYDIDPERIKESRENVRTNGVEHLVTIRQADIFTLDLRDADVVTLYLLPQLNVRLMPQLRLLKPGSRIVSHDFDMRGAEPNEVEKVMVPYEDGDAVEHTIYKWIVPWKEQKDAAGD
jgi:ubiquinone/menaquinone biosynthesis C-methylase UbiE